MRSITPMDWGDLVHTIVVDAQAKGVELASVQALTYGPQTLGVQVAGGEDALDRMVEGYDAAPDAGQVCGNYTRIGLTPGDGVAVRFYCGRTRWPSDG